MNTDKQKRTRYVNCENYREVIESLNAGFYVTALDGTILDHNAEFARLLGFDAQENLVGNPALNFWQDLKARDIYIERLKQDGVIKHYQAAARNQNGEPFWGELSARLVPAKAGMPAHIEGTLTDVTWRVKAEDELHRQAVVMDAFLNVPQETTALLDPQGNLLFINENGAHRFAMHPKEMLGKNIYALIAEPVSSQRKRLIDAVIRTGEPAHFEDERAGTHFSNSVYAVHDPQTGELMGTAVFAVDITEKKFAEQEIKSLALFPSENPNPILRADKDGQLVYANPASAALLQKWNCQPNQDLPPAWKERVTQAYTSGQKQSADEICVSGIYALEIVPIPAGGYAILYGRDVTEARQAEQALRQSERHHRTALYSIGDGVIATDTDGRVTQMNPAAEKLTGWEETQARGKPIADVFHIINEDTRQEVESPVARVLREDVVIGLANHTLLIARDGTSRPVADSGAPIRDDNGDIAGVVLVFRDQSAEREAEKKLQASEQKYRYLFDNAVLPIFRTSPDGKIVAANQSFLRLFGYVTLEELTTAVNDVGRDLFADPARRAEIIRQKAEDPDKTVFENLCRRKDGSTFLGQLTVRQLIEPDGKTYFDGFITDITAQRRAEEALRESEEKFRSIFENSTIGVFLTDIEGRYLDVNPVFCQMCGYSAQELLAASLYQLTHPEDVEMGKAHMQNVISKARQSVRYIKRYIHKSGRILWVEAGSALITNSRGEPLYVVTHVVDITEQRADEQKIRQQLDELQRWYDLTLDRETRNIELKREVNALLSQLGQAARYPGAEI